MEDLAPFESEPVEEIGGRRGGMLTVLDLFSGIGGFSLGLEATGGFRTVAFCETDPFCRKVLARHWPDVPNLGDVRDVDPPAADVVCGGDPCPSRSRARGNRPSVHPDLAGWFLSLVGRCRPRWVVRENVPAPDARDFAAGLELLGYGVVSIELDARDFTGQSRRRQFLCGGPVGRRASLARAVSDAAHGRGFGASRSTEEAPVAACLTAHPMRLAAEDTYCFEPGRGLRVLDADEAEALQGFAGGWTAGFPVRRRRALVGNAVVPAKVAWIGRRILEAEAGGEAGEAA